jgi:hypothetical protein
VRTPLNHLRNRSVPFNLLPAAGSSKADYRCMACVSKHWRLNITLTYLPKQLDGHLDVYLVIFGDFLWLLMHLGRPDRSGSLLFQSFWSQRCLNRDGPCERAVAWQPMVRHGAMVFFSIFLQIYGITLWIPTSDNPWSLAMLDGQLFTTFYCQVWVCMVAIYHGYMWLFVLLICALRLDAQPAVLKAGITDARAAAGTSEAPGILQA